MSLDLASIRREIETSHFMEALALLDSECEGASNPEYNSEKSVLRIAALSGLADWNQVIEQGNRIRQSLVD